DKMKLWFTRAHTEKESFVGEIHDFCFGLRVTLNKRVLRFGLKFHLKWHAFAAFGVGYKCCRFLRAAAFSVGHAGASLENSRNLRTRWGIGYADLEYRRCLTDFICNIIQSPGHRLIVIWGLTTNEVVHAQPDSCSYQMPMLL
nr:hypothetical protein [Tanacetum cinerariifolium]